MVQKGLENTWKEIGQTKPSVSGGGNLVGAFASSLFCPFQILSSENVLDAQHTIHGLCTRDGPPPGPLPWHNFSVTAMTVT